MIEYLKRALDDAHVVELRHLTNGRATSGTFDNLDALLSTTRKLSADGNLYTTLNRPAGARATNRMNAKALRNDDIGVICRIPFDLDPVRPVGTSSTDLELAAACEVRQELVTLLSSYGWPMPALAISGNGAHALYRVRVKATDGWRRAAAALYAGIDRALLESQREAGVNFDVSVKNPARIWRLYGTVNRKGEATPERPHRNASIRLPAGAWQVVDTDTLKRTIAALRSPPAAPQTASIGHNKVAFGSGDYRTLDAVRWFRAHGAYKRWLPDGKHAVRCPWGHEHTTTSPTGTDTVIWERGDSGWPTFHCSHAHCEGRTLRDVMALWDDADAFCAKEYEHG